MIQFLKDCLFKIDFQRSIKWNTKPSTKIPTFIERMEPRVFNTQNNGFLLRFDVT